MSSLGNLKVRTKLILLVTVPLLGLLYFSISSTIERAVIAREMGKLESLVELSVKIGGLAHELQKERGIGAQQQQPGSKAVICVCWTVAGQGARRAGARDTDRRVGGRQIHP